jgi:FdhD protein
MSPTHRGRPPPSSLRPAAQVSVTVRSVSADGFRPRSDVVATEEPLEIRLAAEGARRVLAITMRTPGNDFELAAGFLYNEGIVSSKDDLDAIRYCLDGDVQPEQQYNVVTVDLSGPMPDVSSLDRHFTTSSACGVCGKASLEGLRMLGGPEIGDHPVVGAEVIRSLPGRLREAQRLFESTGGLHASALYDPAGELIELREDVGRHNAMDKLVGWALLHDRLPLADRIVLVSGRASFEIMQKARRAGAPIVAAVGAPSSLAVEVAEDFGMTLVGFLKPDSFNIYTGATRIR